jgi:hypothetical protein
MRMAELQAGWDVVGNDGHKLGTIREVGQHYVLVSTSRFSENLYVPASAIGNVERDVVHLSLTVRDAASMGWGQPPRDEDLPQGDQSDLHRHV